MKVWVLRHGEAEPHARSDDQRRLTQAGRGEVMRSAGRLCHQKIEAIIASPYLRAQETARLVHDTMPGIPIVTVPWLTPDSEPRRVITGLDALGFGQVLLVSHQPLVSNLVSLLEHGNEQHRRHMGTACLVELEGEDILIGGMTLTYLQHP